MSSSCNIVFNDNIAVLVHYADGGIGAAYIDTDSNFFRSSHIISLL